MHIKEIRVFGKHIFDPTIYNISTKEIKRKAI